MRNTSQTSAAVTWRLQLRNHEHDLAKAAGERAFDLGIDAACATDPAERYKLIAEARLELVEACTLTGRLWEQMASERGVTLDELVASSPDLLGVVANVGVLLSNLDGLERETDANFNAQQQRNNQSQANANQNIATGLGFAGSLLKSSAAG